MSERDLGKIVTLLEIAALSLSACENQEFSLDELVCEANEIAGRSKKIARADAEIVLPHLPFLCQRGGRLAVRNLYPAE